jgi:hypothetical protein
MRNLSPWAAVASVVFAAAATTAWGAYEPTPAQSEGSGMSSDSASPTTAGTMAPDRSTPDERHDDTDRGSGATPEDFGPRGVPRDALRHQWPNGAGTSEQGASGATGNPDSSAMPGGNTEDQGTTDSQQAAPENPASPFSPANPAAPALQDPQGGDPTNPVTPANMRYLILA